MPICKTAFSSSVFKYPLASSQEDLANSRFPILKYLTPSKVSTKGSLGASVKAKFKAFIVSSENCSFSLKNTDWAYSPYTFEGISFLYSITNSPNKTAEKSNSLISLNFLDKK